VQLTAAEKFVHCMTLSGSDVTISFGRADTSMLVQRGPGLATRFAKGCRLLTLNRSFNRFVVTGTGTDSKNE